LKLYEVEAELQLLFLSFCYFCRNGSNLKQRKSNPNWKSLHSKINCSRWRVYWQRLNSLLMMWVFLPF